MHSVLPPPIYRLVDLQECWLQKAKRIMGIGPASVRHRKADEVETQPSYPLEVCLNKRFVAVSPLRVQCGPFIMPIRKLFLKVEATPALALHARSTTALQSRTH